MKRTLIPKSRLDRAFLLIALFAIVLSALAVASADYLFASFEASCAVGLLIIVYVFQDETTASASVAEYSAVIGKILKIGAQLSDLSKFLEKERARVADIEATVRKLRDEKTKLEPVVNMQKRDVEAVLAAYSERTSRQAWKERLLSFTLGLVASLIASFVYERLKR
jgi:sensor c-di-GMP phosphodiesterase-like protein